MMPDKPPCSIDLSDDYPKCVRRKMYFIIGVISTLIAISFHAIGWLLSSFFLALWSGVWIGGWMGMRE